MVMIILEVEVETEIIEEERNPVLRSNSRVGTNHDHVRCYRC